MKKILLFIGLLLGFAGSSFADDQFSVDNITLPQNGEADVVVRFSLDAGSTCSGYTLWLQVPTELAFGTYIKNDETRVTYTLGDCYDGNPTFTPNINEIEDPWYSDRFDLVFNQIYLCIQNIIKNI